MIGSVSQIIAHYGSTFIYHPEELTLTLMVPNLLLHLDTYLAVIRLLLTTIVTGLLLKSSNSRLPLSLVNVFLLLPKSR